jgi:hypothetical protein
MSQQNFNDLPEIEFSISSSGITIFSPTRLTTPRYLQFDSKGRCQTCKSDNVEVDYVIQREGVTIFCSRLKQEKYIPFDTATPIIVDRAFLRIKTRNRSFNLPFNRSQTLCCHGNPSNGAGDQQPRVMPSVAEALVKQGELKEEEKEEEMPEGVSSTVHSGTEQVGGIPQAENREENERKNG